MGVSWVPWGMFSIVGDIMMHVEDIISTIGGVQSSTFLLFSTMRRHHDEYVADAQYLHIYQSWYSPTVLNILQGTQDTLHGTEHTLYGVKILNLWKRNPLWKRYPVQWCSNCSPRHWTAPTVLNTHYTRWFYGHKSLSVPRFWTEATSQIPVTLKNEKTKTFETRPLRIIKDKKKIVTYRNRRRFGSFQSSNYFFH